MATSTSFGPVDGRNVFAANQFPGATINIGDSKDPPRRPQVCRAIHFPRNDDFVQRSAISEQLTRLLPPQANYQSAALWGLGGSGKTQLALEYAYSRCSDPACSVFWVHADTETSFAQDYKDIAIKLGLEDTLDGEKLLTAVRNHIETLPKWVLVLDNADDLTLFGVGRGGHGTMNNGPNLSVYVPRGTVGTVLWTSRDQRIAGSIVGPRRGINVVRMTDVEAETLFQAIAVLENSEEESDNVQQLLEELNWLPLAITQAAAYIRRTKISSAGYLRAIKARKKRWKTLKRSEHDRFRRPEVSNSVLQTYNISMGLVQQENKLAYDILTVLAYTDSQNISFEMITKIALANADRDRYNNGKDESHPNDCATGASESSASDSEDDDFCDDVMDAVMRLEEFSFLASRTSLTSTRDNTERSYDMHKLVQEAVLYNLHMQESSEVEARLSRIALQVIDGLFPGGPHRERWSQCEQYLGHAQRSLEWLQIHGDADDVVTLLEKVSDFLFEVGRWREEDSIDLAIVDVLKRTHGIEHPRTLLGMSNLATTYNELGKYDQAEKLLGQVIALRREVLGVNHANTLQSMTALATTYYRQGRYDKSEKIDKEILAVRRETLGHKHPETIQSMAELATTYHQQRRYDEAEKIYEEVLALRREILGANHLDTIRSMADLSTVYNQQRRYKEAQQMREEALARRREMLGDKHPDTLQSMAYLATTYYQQGRYSEAEKIRKEALALRQEILGGKHPDTISSMGDLATTFYQQKRYKEAEIIYKEVSESRREMLGETHPDTISSMVHLATTYYQQEKYEEAEIVDKEVLALRREILGDWHRDTIRSMAGLASTYCQLGRYDEAESMNKKELERLREILGGKHPDTITSMACLGTTYYRQGRYDEAENIEKEVLELRREVLGDGHRDTIQSMENLKSTQYALSTMHDTTTEGLPVAGLRLE